MEPTPQELMDKYSKEMDADVYIDAINVLERQYSLPSIKNKWLTRKSQQEWKLIRLVEEKEDLVANKFGDNPLNLSKVRINHKADHDPEIIRRNREIIHQELLIRDLTEKINKNLTQMSFDIKNIIELIKQEQL